MKNFLLTIVLMFIFCAFSCNNIDSEKNTDPIGNADSIEKTNTEQVGEVQNFKTITFASKDNLLITADLYMTSNEKAPLIILFHQAGFSRGEYQEIAPKLNALGFNCLATDQRSGREVNGVENKTAQEAQKLGLPVEYINAFPDLQATLEYVVNNFPSEKIIIWGSSYSAALNFVLGSKYKEKIHKILAFSPGEYFTFENRMIQDFAAEIDCPVFITSAKGEHESWKGIFERLKDTNKQFYLPETEGFHGSRALWEQNQGNEKVWEAVKTFLLK